MWDAETGVEIATLSANEREVYCCAFSPSGDVVVGGTGEPFSGGELRILDGHSYEGIGALMGHRALVWALRVFA